MLIAASLAILVTMVMATLRGLLGPTIYDRILAMNMFGTKTVLLVAVVAYLYERPDFLDLALAYALVNFIGVLAVLQFFQYRQAREDQGKDQKGASS
ncbi:MAG: monovalent cation/H+ antiporter complex subunit F [Orrella sp.]